MKKLCAECGNTSLSKEHGQKKKVLADAAKEKQEGIQGQWQQESPFKEVLEQVKGYPDTDCSAHIMGRAFHAVKSGNWEGFKEEFQKKTSSANGLVPGSKKLTRRPQKL